MKRYEFLEHTADAKFRSYGDTLEGAFANAALAMSAVMFEPEKVKPATERSVEAEGNDEQSLLYNWLEELLILLDTEGFLLNRVKSIRINKEMGVFRLNAEIEGDLVEQGYETHGDVKAITYNEMEIKKENNKYVVQAVVDI
ncbi:MAG: archease [Candidatus Woesearchaeota archaeon]